MLSEKIKRCFLLTLVMLLALTLIPAYTLGAEAAEEPARAIQSRIDALLALYGVTADMTDEEIFNAIVAADGDTIQQTFTEREAIEADAMALTEAELLTLELDLYERFWNVFDPLFTPAPAVTVTGVSGVEVTVDSNGSVSESSGTVTAKVTGSFTTRKTTTITVTNTSGSTATISFDYSVSTHDSSVSTIDDLAGADSGSYSILLTAGATKTFTMCSKRFTSSTTATATLKNFKVEEAAAESNVTVTYGSLGSVKVDGTTAVSGSVHSVNSSTGASFVAAPGSGNKFVAWIDPATNAVLSTSATFQVIPTEDMAIKAVFTNASSAPMFWANGTTLLYESFDAAISYASSASNKTISLASDATLPAGNYTIPAGVTLLIPYDAANTLYTTEPATVDSYTKPKPSVFRTLTMAEDANITIEGAISISGKQCAAKPKNGMPTGPLGFIAMNTGSKITVESGAYLYVWGYITGSGSVEVKSGGTVYEHFQMADYRGGDATSNIVAKDDAYGVFPFNQFFIQNVEVPMTLHAGSAEIGFGSVDVTLAGIQKMRIPFFGATIDDVPSMFVIESGYVVKDYIENTGRLDVKIYGDLSMEEVNLSLKVSLLGSIEIDSSKYALPIPNHMTISLEEGSMTLNQTTAFLPGSELYVKEGTTATLGSGKSVYIYDWDQWVYNDGANGYAGTENLPYFSLPYVPGGNGTTGREKDALVQIDGTVDASKGSVYVTSSGANIYSTGTGVVKVASTTDTTIYQVITNGSSIASWPEIAMKPAILKNMDGTTVNTASKDNGDNGGYGDGTYTYKDGFWHKPGCDGIPTETVTTAPTCTNAGEKTVACTCGVINRTEEVAATGHTPGEAVVTYPTFPTHEQEGTYVSVVSCTACGAEISREEGTAPKVAVLSTLNVSADAETILAMKFYLPESLTNNPNATVTVSKNLYGATIGTPATYGISELDKDLSGRYVISMGFASGEMTCDVVATFTDGSGQTVKVRSGNEITDDIRRSVVDYAHLVLNQGNDAQKSLISALLTYGGYAQIHFGTDKDFPAYMLLGYTPDVSNVTADTITQEVTTSGDSIGITQNKQNAHLASAISLTVFFELDDGYDITDYTFKLTYEVNHNTHTKVLTPVHDSANDRYYVDIEDIPAAYLDYMYTITVSSSEGTYTVKTSVLAYLKNVLASGSATEAQKNLARAMYLYNQAANDFFGK